MLFPSIKLLRFNTGIKLSLSSPLIILKWSLRQINEYVYLGCVSEPYTIDMKTGFPVINGLFCERIFGPILSWQCKCGLFNSLFPIKKSYVCPLCNSENTNSTVRRYRLGYIHLNSPVYHTAYLENNFLSMLTEITQPELLNLAYFNFLSSTVSACNNYSLSQLLFSSEFIKYKLSNLNLIDKIIEYRSILHNSHAFIRQDKWIKSIHFLNLLLLNNINPEWLLLIVLPIIPAGLRPLMRLDCNTLAVSNINELYRIIITKNNRVKKLKRARKKSTILFELLEKCNIQKTIDLLLSNKKVHTNSSLKISSNYFKCHLLGKRVNFSGRSVITSGPTLSYLHIGLPFTLGIKLFEFHLLQLLQKNKILKTLLTCSYYTNSCALLIKRLLNFILRTQLILVNRAPTLHRMNIQAFKPYLIESNAIKLFPIACSGFNADFDGDQMGIFILTSCASNKESKYQLITDKNILHPSTFKNIFKYSQTIVLGLDILSTLKYNEKNQYIFNSINEALNYYIHDLIDLNSNIIIKLYTTNILKSKIVKKYIFTSIGKIFLRFIL